MNYERSSSVPLGQIKPEVLDAYRRWAEVSELNSMSDVETLMQWTGCALGVAGSFILARNDRHSGWGFVAYLGSSAAWLVYGLATDVHALVTQHLVFTVVSGFGVWRWLVLPHVGAGRRTRGGWRI